MSSRSVWVSRADLEDEYVKSLGHTNVWEAIKSSRHFSKNERRNCAMTGPNGMPTEADVANFCRRKSVYKVKAALSVLHLFTPDNARRVSSIENLLKEIES